MKASVTPQASSDMAQTSNAAQNNTAETKKGTNGLKHVQHFNVRTDTESFLAACFSDTALVPNVSIDDLKQMKVGIF